MDDFEEISNPVVEFQSTWREDRYRNCSSKSVATDPLAKPQEQYVQVVDKAGTSTQTEAPDQNVEEIDENKLATWLRRIYPMVEQELLDGVTQVYGPNFDEPQYDLHVKLYQQISCVDQSTELNKKHGAATWLSVCVNNVAALVISTSSSHNNWCKHVEQSVVVFLPKRVGPEGSISFIEEKRIPVKSCIKTLATNCNDKNIFAGGSISGDVYVWEFNYNNGAMEVKELFFDNTDYGCVVDIVWLTKTCMVTCHEDGFVCMWQTLKMIYKDKCFRLSKSEVKSSFPPVFTAIVNISTTDVIIGTQDGALFLCSTCKYASDEDKDNYFLWTTKQESHKFQVTSLLKACLNGVDIVISCDIGGDINFHDIRNFEDGPIMSYKIPVPFKCYITCSDDAEYLFFPSEDGSLEIFGVRTGVVTKVQGSLTGKGSVIRVTDNGKWIVTGCYEGWFEIFSVEQK